MSNPTNSTKQDSPGSSSETFFLLPGVYSESDNDRSRPKDVAAKGASTRNNSPSKLHISTAGVQGESEAQYTDNNLGMPEVPSKAEEPLTGNTLDELEEELVKQPASLSQSPLEKADSLLDDAEHEFEVELAKAMVRRSEYWPASSDESDAAQESRTKKAPKTKEPEQESPTTFRVKALESLMAELMDPSTTSQSAEGKEGENNSTPVPQASAAKILPAVATEERANVPSPIATRPKASPSSPTTHGKKEPSTSLVPSTTQAEPLAAPVPSPSHSKFAMIPNFNPMAWLQRHDSPQEELRDRCPSKSPSAGGVPVDNIPPSHSPVTERVAPARPTQSSQQLPRRPSLKKQRQPTQDQSMPAWVCPGYKGPLPERIKIPSPYLMAVFEDVMRGKEDWTCDEDLILCRPYRSLIRHEALIRKLPDHLSHRMHRKSQGSHQMVQACFADTFEDSDHTDLSMNFPDTPVDGHALFGAKLLISFIDNCLKPHISRVTSEDFQEIDFADLWYLFKPGGLVVSANEDQAYRVVEVEYHTCSPRKRTSSAFGIKCISMDYDGRNIGPVVNFFRIEKYSGSRDITSLPVYPLRCNDDPSGLQRILVDRGRKFMRAVIHRHMYCMGTTLDDHEQVNGNIMIDFEQAISRNPLWKPGTLDIGQSLQDRILDEGCPSYGSGEHEPLGLSTDREMASEYLSKHEFTAPYLRAKKMEGDELSVSDDELMLLTHRVFGFILRTRKWASFNIDHIHNVSSTMDYESFKRLVLPQGHKSMLESLVRSHFRKREGKIHSRKLSNTLRGEVSGLNILLHGAPGTGKTWTAECIAGYFEKPFLSFTCGELGTTPADVTQQLETIFTLAQKWDCVLLIDDADMLLSERAKDNSSLDSLAAAFMRALDHYSGILFLTTSCVSIFDEGFRSRIQFSLYYPPLDEKSNLDVWNVCIWQTRKRQRTVRIKEEEILELAAELWDTGDPCRWNGRQIRNAFQTALALAEANAHDPSDPSRPSSRTSPRRDSRWQDSRAQPAVTTLRRRHFETVAQASIAFAQRLLPNSAGAPASSQQRVDNFSVRDLKRSTSVARRERASTMPEARRPSQAALPALPPLPEGGGGGAGAGAGSASPTRRPSVASRPNRLTHRARNSVGTSLRQEIWPAREGRESGVPVLPELPAPKQRESAAEMWDVDPDRHDFTMRIPYETLRL